MNNIPLLNRSVGVALLLVVSCLGPVLFGAEKIALKDDFENVMPEVATGSIRSETTWYGFTANGGRLPTPRKITIDDYNANVLEFSAQSQLTLLVGAFPSVELKKAGDSVQLSLSYRYMYPLKHVTPAFVIGLYCSNGVPLTAGNLHKNLPPGAAGSNHAGYRLAKLPQEKKGDLQLDQSLGLGATFPQELLASSSSGLELNFREMHSLVLNITLAEDGNLAFNYNVDGVSYQYVTTSRTRLATTRFDEAYICPVGRGFPRGEGNSYIQIGSVRVITKAQ